MAPSSWSWTASAASPSLLVCTPTHPTNDFAQPINAFAPQNTLPHLSRQWHVQDTTVAAHEQQQQPLPRSSRKRSRDEMTEGIENDSDSSRASTTPFRSARPTPSPPKHSLPSELNAAPGYGSGDGGDLPMAGSLLDAGGPPGTWAEELSERLRSSSMREQQMQSQSQPRPALEARKSMRLDRSTDEQGSMENIIAPSAPLTNMLTPEANGGSTIDEAAMTLGIGWSSIPANSTMDAASRGWARHIETHFPLQDVRIIWINKSIPAYLASAVTREEPSPRNSPSPPFQYDHHSGSLPTRSPSPWAARVGSPGYFLFDEQMNQGRLVAKSWERAMENLRQTPLAFEGLQILQSTQIWPRAEAVKPHYWAGWGMRKGGSGASSALWSPAVVPVRGDVSSAETGNGADHLMDMDMEM